MFPPLRPNQAFRLGGLTLREIVVRVWKKIEENEILTRASAIAFYAMLSSVPFLAMLLSALVQLLPDLSGITDRHVGIGNISVEELRTLLRSVFPREAYAVVEDQIARLQKDLQSRPPIALLVLGIATTLWLASSLYTEVIAALDRIYGVTETRSFVKIRLIAIVMTIVQASVLLGALVAIVVGPEIFHGLGFRAHEALWGRLIQFLFVWLMVLLSFALTFSVGPNAEQKWEWITPGSLLGSMVFLSFTYGFRIYVQNFANYNKTYGSLGGVMVLLFWFWLSSLVLLVAAQVNNVIADASQLRK